MLAKFSWKRCVLVMAEEVAAIMPAAVAVAPDGYYRSITLASDCVC